MRTTLVLAAALLTAGHALSVARANEAPAAPVVQSVDAGSLLDWVDSVSGEMSPTRIAEALRERYLEAYGGARPSAMDDQALAAMFAALEVVAFHSSGAAPARELLSLASELERRSLATAQQLETVHAALVAARLLDEARAFHDAHPDLEARRVPAVEDRTTQPGGAPPVLVWDAGRGMLVRESVDLDAEYQVLVVSHPSCGFSQAASGAIRDDPELGPLFERHATWIVAPPGNLPLDAIERWQSAQPAQRIALIDSPPTWSFIEVGQTPTFYFLRNGDVVERVQGWPDKGNREALVAALQGIGAMPVRDGGPVESRGDNIQSRGGTAIPVDTYNQQVDELAVGPCDEGACDTPPRLVQGVAPVYPPAAVLAEIEGSASVLFDLDADGRVVNAVVEEATHPAMGESALAALAQWRFEPARLQGRPVPLRQLRQVFPFQLVGPAVPPASPDDWGLLQSHPIEVCKPEGQRRYLARLVCPNRQHPEFRRVGSVGPRAPIPEAVLEANLARWLAAASAYQGLEAGDPDYHMVDHYELDCGDSSTSLYLDMYHCDAPPPDAAPRGFDLLY